jgi:hypothetical protein
MITYPLELFIWTNTYTKAFESLCSQLLALATLYHFDPNLPIKLETDSSDGVIVGVFS